MKSMTIGQVARQADLGVETVRFYERKGLIHQPPRRASGYRQYDADVVARLQFIRRAKQLGFTLAEIKELLSLRIDPDSTCGDVKQRAEVKIADIEEKLRTLRRMKQSLVKLTQACGRTGGTSDCPILETLNGEETS